MAVNKIPAKTRRKVYASTGGRCWYCGAKLSYSQKDADKGGAPLVLCVDHVVAKHLGGENDSANMVPSCKPCNSAKRVKTVTEFRQYMARKVNGAPSFTSQQIEWLEQQGFEFPDPSTIKFWGEQP